MTINYSTLLGLTKPVTGTQSGTWGDDVNTGLTDYLDSAIAGAQVISGSATAVTLTKTTGTSSAPTALTQVGSGSSGSSQYQIIRCTGNPASLLTITAPADDKTYIVINATSTSQSVKIVGAGPTTGVTIVSGERAFVAWNGSDFVKVGGAAGGSPTQVQYNNAGVFGGISNATTDGTTLSMTSPKVITGINDTNGNELLKVTATASAVNELTLANAATGNAPTLSATGGDTDVGITIATKGAGSLALGASQTGAATWTAGGAGQTGAITLDQSTKTHTLNIGTGATENAATKTINIGTAGVSGSTTTINIGSAVSGATTNVTLSAGTANGVAYLNGSNVLTTGSALTFDGTNLGIGTSSPTAKVHAYDTSNSKVLSQTTTGYAQFQASSTSGDFHLVIDNSTGAGFGSGAYARLLYSTGAYPLVFSTNATERMRIDSSGNLGIGTSSPAYKLDVIGSAKIQPSSGYNFFFQTSGTTARINYLNDALSANVSAAYRATDFEWQKGDGSPVLNLNSSGNLGIGVTPSAWDSASKAFQISSHAVFAAYTSGTNQQALLLNNAYLSATGYKYLNSNYATYYQQQASAGSHSWFTAPSGTAGNAISFTQAMTLESTGRLLIGATSNPNAYQFLVSTGSSAVNNAAFFTNTSDADLSIKLTSGVTLLTPSTGVLAFGTSNTERARIDSSGNLLVGTTSGSFHRLHKASASDFAVQSANTSATTPYVHVLTFTAAAPNDATSMFLRCDDTGLTGRIQLRSNGGIANYSANDVNLSDRREKTNFAPAKSYLDTICAIPVQTFNYIDQNLEEDAGLTLGVVAQDVQEVAPELVMESNWGTKEEPKMRLSIYQTDLQYALMKCIQEQQALITALTARVAALEGTQP